jgi:hypothetical protein
VSMAHRTLDNGSASGGGPVIARSDTADVKNAGVPYASYTSPCSAIFSSS